MREMKDSGVEWIGEIPSHWPLMRFKDKYINKKEIAKEQSVEYERLALTMNGVIKRPKDDAEGLQPKEFDGYQIVRTNDFIFKMIDLQNISTSRVGLSPYTGLVSPAYIRFSPKQDGQFNQYVYYFLMSLYYNRVFNNLGGNGVRSALNAKDMGDFVIPFPTEEDQRRICAYIDSQKAGVDALISNVQAQIEKLKAYKQSLITEVVTKGLDPTVPMKDSGVEWLGKVPQRWEVYRIANLYAERSESGLPELPLLTVSINTGVSDHEVDDADKGRVFIRMEDRTKYKRVCPGDLTYNMMRAWQGAFGAVRVNGLVSPAYVVAKPKNEIPLDSRYIEALLRTPVAIEEMHRYSRGIIDFRLRLYWPEFKNIQICLPPFDEQTRIADYIDEIASKVDSLIAIKQAKIEKLEQYKRSLIYEYVTGKKEVPSQN